MIYSDTCLSWTSSRTSFSVRNRQAFGIHRLNSQRFPPLGFYWKFGLYRIPVFSGFGLNGFHCTLVLLQNIPFDSPYHISIFNRFIFKNPFTKITDLCLNWHNTMLIVVQVTYFCWLGSKVHCFTVKYVFHSSSWKLAIF